MKRKRMYQYISHDYKNKEEHRTQKCINSHIAITQLKDLKFRLHYDVFYGVRVTFQGIWAFAQFPSSFFESLDKTKYVKIMRENKSRDLTMNDQIYLDFLELIDVLRNEVERILSSVRLNYESYFSAWGFFLLLYKKLSLNRVTDYQFEEMFQLLKTENEIGGAIDRLGLYVENFENFGYIRTPVLRSTYYLNNELLIKKKDFVVVNDVCSRQVLWSTSKSATQDQMFNKFIKNVDGFQNYFCHIEQSADWPHIFEFGSIEDVAYYQKYEVYRKWVEWIQLIRGFQGSVRRYSSSIVGVLNDEVRKYSLLSACPPPFFFDMMKHSDLYEFELLIDKIYDDFLRENRSHWCLKRWDMHRGFMFSLDEEDFDIAFGFGYRAVNFSNLVEVIDYAMYGESYDNGNVRYNPLPNPEIKLDTNMMLNTDTDLVRVGTNMEAKIMMTHLFSTLMVNCESDENWGMEYGVSLEIYRSKKYYQIRSLTKKPTIYGSPLDQTNFLNFIKDDQMYEEIAPNFHEIVMKIKEQEVGARIKWNDSTFKLLSVLMMLELSEIIRKEAHYSFQYVGVKNEPMVTLTSYASKYKTSANYGSEGMSPNFRSGIEQNIQAQSHDIIISDVDQSNAKDEIAVANIVSRQINQLLKNAQTCLVYKMQYTTPSILIRITTLLKDKYKVRLEMCKIFKSTLIGVLGLETFIVMVKGDRIAMPTGKEFLQYYESINLYDTDLPLQSYKSFPLRDVGDVKLFRDNKIAGYIYALIENEEQLEFGVSMMLHVCNNVNFYPINAGRNANFLIYGEKNLDRCSLTTRRGGFGTAEDIFGSMAFPKGSSQSSISIPYFIPHGAQFDPPLYFNIMTSRIIKRTIDKYMNDVGWTDQNASILDIGGRNMSKIAAVETWFDYTILDKVGLPDYVNQYHIQILDGYTNWEYNPRYGDYDIIFCIFTINADRPSIVEVRRRIDFFKQIVIEHPSTIILFNVYTNADWQGLRQLKSDFIFVDEEGENGSFVGYDPVPLIPMSMLNSDPYLHLIECSHLDLIETQFSAGLCHSQELYSYLQSYWSFSPLVKVQKPQ